MTTEAATMALEKVRVAHEAFTAADARRQSAVLEARQAGASWTAIGQVIGTTKQGARQRYVGAEEISKMASMLDARLKLFAQGRNRLLSYAEALELALSEGVLIDTQGKAVRAVYGLNVEARAGKLIPWKEADLLADECIQISAALFAATPQVG